MRRRQDNPLSNPKLTRWLYRLTRPTLVLWGAEDRLRPAAQARTWERHLPDAEVVLVPDTGHLVFEDTPQTGQIVTNVIAT